MGAARPPLAHMMLTIDRRSLVLGAGFGLGALLVAPGRGLTQLLAAKGFTHSVASGEPGPDSMPWEKLVLVPVWREAGGLFDDRERAALAWAEAVTRVAETGVPQSDYDAAAGIFDDKELADLTVAIGLMNAYNRLAISFRRPPSAARNGR